MTSFNRSSPREFLVCFSSSHAGAVPFNSHHISSLAPPRIFESVGYLLVGSGFAPGLNVWKDLSFSRGPPLGSFVKDEGFHPAGISHARKGLIGIARRGREGSGSETAPVNPTKVR